ncbi:FAD binding domain-containing protein [Suillus plorans]|uniref:FAD binding domain-containing protein n=1 Tax=Suillus plorans TaxID=116603 RepID=A0A9P7DDN9_9AGAM|nr:FAD binding domain-containing protein [Suillus plorans]KAG1788650.1 FAD binding domain-containing protein [Suillus plorans]
MNETEGGFAGIVCKDGTRVVTGDIRLTGVGLDRVQFFLFGRELDLTKIAQSEELVFETIASLIPTEITSNKVVWMSDFRANMRMVNKFGEGRVFVAGDAAHGWLGMGLDSGVQDAFNLGWKLALVEKGIANKSLLETYSAERLPVISEMLEVSHAAQDAIKV